METEHEQLENKIDDVSTIAENNGILLEKICNNLGIPIETEDEDDETLADDLLG